MHKKTSKHIQIQNEQFVHTPSQYTIEYCALYSDVLGMLKQTHEKAYRVCFKCFREKNGVAPLYLISNCTIYSKYNHFRYFIFSWLFFFFHQLCIKLELFGTEKINIFFRKKNIIKNGMWVNRNSYWTFIQYLITFTVIIINDIVGEYFVAQIKNWQFIRISNQLHLA